MSDACDGLRQMSGAYATKDHEGLIAGYTETGALHPASEEVGGDDPRRGDIFAVTTATRAMFTAAYEPPENNNGELVWRGLPLSKADQNRVDGGMKTCEQY